MTTTSASRPPRGSWRDSRVLLAGLIVLIAIVGVFFERRDAARRRADLADTTSAAPAMVDLDQDGAPDPLPVRRLGDNPAAGPALQALVAAGGYAPWSSGPALAADIDEIYFDDRGLIRDTRRTHLLMNRTGAPRLVISSEDGRWKMGIGDGGPWARGKGDNGLWSEEAGPGSLPAPERNRQVLRTAWLHRLPYILGDVDVTLTEQASDPADSLLLLLALRPPAPGDTAARRTQLGFDPESRHLARALFLGEDPATLVRFDEYHADVAGTPVRPHRLSFLVIDPESIEPRRLLEIRLGPIDWNPVVDPGAFEPPL